MSTTALNSEQRRQLINVQQVYASWRTLNRERRRRYSGSMRWGARSGGHYLLRKIGASEKSLGPKSEATEAVYEAFTNGRDRSREALRGLGARLDDMAPVNRAMRLGRMPQIAARIARHCDDRDILGDQIFIVGTNALFAYEALAGANFDAGLLATDDLDILYDARRRLSFAARGRMRAAGLIGILQKADRSFVPVAEGAYRAANKDGYLVDLICAEARNFMHDPDPRSLSDLDDDLRATAIFGLEWLVNAPKVEAIAIDDRGYPAPLVAIDPRVFALHKLWLSERTDRPRLKTARDLEQARAVAQLAAHELGLDFNGADLSALPAAMRRRPDELGISRKEPSGAPNW